MKKLYSIGVLALLTLVTLMILGCRGSATGAASGTACLQLEDIYFNKFDCCGSDFPGCNGVQNAYSKAGCGTLTCVECPCPEECLSIYETPSGPALLCKCPSGFNEFFCYQEGGVRRLHWGLPGYQYILTEADAHACMLELGFTDPDQCSGVIKG